MNETLNENKNENKIEIKQAVEAMLFVSHEPVPIEKIQEVLSVSLEEILITLKLLKHDYDTKGIQIKELAGGWQMCTSQSTAPYVEKFLSLPPKDFLTKASLEILAIIAYRQPVTRHQIEAIRGVKTDKLVTVLMEKRLIKPLGKADTLGRPFLYGTTEEFLRYFGLNSLSDLPPLPQIETTLNTQILGPANTTYTETTISNCAAPG